MNHKTKIELIALAIISLIGLFTVVNGHEIFDSLHLLSYQPSKAVSDLADDAGMNEKGKKLFYRFSPQITKKQELQNRCQQAAHPVGCVSGNTIYILEPENAVDEQEIIVTAAHEMLHVAYSRLSNSEKELLTEEFSSSLSTAESDIVSDIQAYRDQDEEIIQDETHSILGSQAIHLSNTLETYYRAYFADRQKAVSAYQLSK